MILTARAIYICIMYLVDGCQQQVEYSYVSTLKYLRKKLKDYSFMGYRVYDSTAIWNAVFLTDMFLVQQMEKKKIKGIDQLYAYAYAIEKTQWRKKFG